MTLQQALELLKKAAHKEPLTADERSKLLEALKIVASQSFAAPK